MENSPGTVHIAGLGEADFDSYLEFRKLADEFEAERWRLIKRRAFWIIGAVVIALAALEIL